jgi:hypothetical protein
LKKSGTRLDLVTFYRLRCVKVIRHSDNIFIQLTDIRENLRQILQDQFSFATHCRIIVLQALKVVSAIPADINEEGGAVPFILVEENIFYGEGAEPITSVHSLASHAVVEVTHLLRMFHEPGEKVKVCVEAALETSALRLLESSFCKIGWQVDTGGCSLIKPMITIMLERWLHMRGRARTHINLNDPSTAGIVSALVIGVGPYVWNPSSEKIPRQQSGLKIRT